MNPERERSRPIKRTLDKAQSSDGRHTYRARRHGGPVAPLSIAAERAARHETYGVSRRQGWAAPGGEPRRKRRQAIADCKPGQLPVLIDLVSNKYGD